ncbi:MAG: DNA polymerase III subunit epsilon [Moraxellaceae bacterium]|nr:DNA polymerase III subunit epsilon [Moraxellaceae bacterium]MBP8852628.1 DNA polymerase III subunit epsilon [Moraxellaceae bacterium]MBP9045791.1 DNA polymerase III subunit epsilon [Moraxellaceae bacterium]MBP9730422.1 DNA polymerase III subunit epsilon [Moraxellaceae bacterium]MCC6199885.1 DNA polymerase III subunit epsilon [Moraxellaceae bacterium]
MRQVILDTETTGIDPSQGHRLIEIGCVELVNRRLTGKTYHCFLNPQREVEEEAMAIHGLSNEFLADKPLFVSVVDEFLAFVRGAELIIHNAPFDVGFINHEFALLNRDLGVITDYCTVLDTLVMAKSRHPGQRNSLDALARRYGADQRDRTYHGALLDSEILADVYLAMTGGQVGLALGGDEFSSSGERLITGPRRLPADRRPLLVIRASEQEMQRHQVKLVTLDKAAGGASLWRRLDPLEV